MRVWLFPFSGPRCIINYFETYLKAIESGIFYRKPLISNVRDKLRYGKTPLGVNKLSSLMREICQKGGLVGNYTNHSGKRTCATALYQAGIDEQEIMGRTGHRSTKSVRTYKTSNATIQKKVSDVVNPFSDHDYENAQKSVQSSEHRVKERAEPFQENKKRCLGDITDTFMNGSGEGSAVTFSNCHFNFN